MEFHDWRSYWTFFRKSARANTPDDFYGELRRIGLSHCLTGNSHAGTVLHNQSLAEQFWYKQGQPYYKVFPEMLGLLLRTKMDVPAQYMRAPFPAFCIRFPKNHQIPELTAGDHEIRSILVDETDDQIDLQRFHLRDTSLPLKKTRVVVAWIDFGEVESDIESKNPHGHSVPLEMRDAPVSAYIRMDAREDASIEECLPGEDEVEGGNSGLISTEGIPIPNTVVRNAFRIVVSICFLATGADRIIEPDVLAKDFRKYVESSKEQRKVLAEKAKRRGKFGWTVGREIIIPSTPTVHDTDSPTGRHLRYAHIRGAHFHLYWTGPNRVVPIVKFLCQQSIRPDLPPPPGGRRGYKANV